MMDFNQLENFISSIANNKNIDFLDFFLHNANTSFAFSKEDIVKMYHNFYLTLNDFFQDNPIPTFIEAFYFGLYESKMGYVSYLFGSSQWTEDTEGWVDNRDFYIEEFFIEFSNSHLSEQDILLLLSCFVLRFFHENLSGNFKLAIGFDDGDIYTLS